MITTYNYSAASTFSDHPRLVPEQGDEFKKTVFKLELVKVSGRDQKKGGDVVLTIDWGVIVRSDDTKYLIEREK